MPALNFSGWYDVFMNGAIENFVGMRAKGGNDLARKGQKLVVGPWIHLPWQQKVGEVDFGPDAANPIDELQLRWFDYWLKGKSNGVSRRAGSARVRDGRQQVAHGRGLADSGHSVHGVLLAQPWCRQYSLRQRLAQPPQKPSADESPDRYRYDPANPVPSKGGHSCCTADTAPVGPFDQAEIQNRADVLVYTTPPLEKAVEVTGPITVTLYAASSAKDTDFTAKLTDVRPDGKAILLNNGIRRASFRESLEKPEPIEPGKVYAYEIAIWPTSNLFKAGHRIRLEISSSNFPHYDRNPNTGRRFGLDSELAVAEQIIYHDPERALEDRAADHGTADRAIADEALCSTRRCAALDGRLECQSFRAGARRSLAAIFTRSARESAFIFRITLPRCAFTVISLMPSSPPTCLFNRPETTNAMTSRSRRLSDA